MAKWIEVQMFIKFHSLPYVIIRFGESFEFGRMVDTFSGETVAESVEQAEQYLKG